MKLRGRLPSKSHLWQVPPVVEVTKLGHWETARFALPKHLLLPEQLFCYRSSFCFGPVAPPDMLSRFLDTITTSWNEAAALIGLGEQALAVAMLGGALAYVAGWRALHQIRTRMTDPRGGTSLLQLFGLDGQVDPVLRRRVTDVFDGDTIEVAGECPVRLIGMDAPENKENEKCLRDAKITGKPPNEIVLQGTESAKWLRKLLGGKTVELELDIQAGRTDRYGRTLAHVWTLNAYGEREMLVAEKMIAIGQARPTAHDHKHESRLARSYEEAKREGRGGNLGVPAPSDWEKPPDTSGGASVRPRETPPGADSAHKRKSAETLTITQTDLERGREAASTAHWLPLASSFRWLWAGSERRSDSDSGQTEKAESDDRRGGGTASCTPPACEESAATEESPGEDEDTLAATGKQNGSPSSRSEEASD